MASRRGVRIALSATAALTSCVTAAPAPQTSAPQTSAPQTSAPQTSAPQTSATAASSPRAAAADPRTVRVAFVRVASGISSPTAIAMPSDGTERIFITEQAGRIRVRAPGSGLLPTPYLDIRDRVLAGGERGLLGLAFHPSFRTNGTFYLAYNDLSGDVRVSRFQAVPSSNRASPASEAVLLDIPHRDFSNHNGGQVAFAMDGFLYVGIGDGGGGGDPAGNAQRTDVLLGKILRIDVDRSCESKRYCIPPDNPFATSMTRRREIWLYGLRNPWRFSFDRSDGTQWIADVGQSAREEIDRLAAGAGGENMGWDCREGTLDTASRFGGSYCSGRSFTGPVFQYGHGGGRCAIIGGYVYRGPAFASIMGGIYVYGDYCSGEVWALARNAGGSWVNALAYRHATALTTFGESVSGELYAADVDGKLYRLTAARR